MTLADLFGVEEWQSDAACAEHPELASAFFPERGTSTRAAKALCRGCLVSADCLAYAIENGIVYGIWGGLSGRERSALRRESSVASRRGGGA